ncbi:unnamed protein product [Symbiodinium natans]|uniref:Exostosin GT47 domain-containing protein n=1 Tax=Symbiodinium natans TaxID=878477 RepID=A0A812MGM6_9DINO|nr:unnamed protein product [Symbiodinium natans]
METHFLEFLQWHPSFRTYDWRVADFIWLAQCTTKVHALQVYLHLRQNYSYSHEAALALADAEYLRILGSYHRGSAPTIIQAFQRIPQLVSAALVPEDTTANFVTVYAIDLGRQDFPASLAETRNWTVGTLPGETDWLQKANLWETWPKPDMKCMRALPDASAPDRCAEGAMKLTPALGLGVGLQGATQLMMLLLGPNETQSTAEGRVFHPHSLYGNMDPAEVWVQGSVPWLLDLRAISSEEEYQDAMLSSKFCLVLRGSSHTNNVRLVDVMAHGCVPVIVSDDFHPPLERSLPWRDVALFFRTAELPRLVARLREVDDAPLRQHLLEGERPVAQALDFARPEYWVDIFHELTGKLELSLQATTPRALALGELRETAFNLYAAFLEQNSCLVEICLSERFAMEDILGCRVADQLWPSLAAIASRARRRGGAPQHVLEVVQEVEDGCTEPLDGQVRMAREWIRLRGSLDPDSPYFLSEPDELQKSCMKPGCFLLLLRGAAASPRSIFGAEPLLTDRRARFVLWEHLDHQWGGLTVWHAGHFMWSLGYVCFLVGLSDMFLFSGALWDDAYAMPALAHVLCGQLEDEEVGLLLQVYGLEESRSMQVLREFRRLYGYG